MPFCVGFGKKAAKKNNMDDSSPELKIEPIKGSLTLLILKLVLAMVISEFIYTVIFYLTNLKLVGPGNFQYLFHHHITIIFLTLNWMNSVYYLADNHLIERKGVLKVWENTYDLDNIRSVSVNQSLIGKIFNFGDVALKMSASGGYQGDVVLKEIANPHQYCQLIKKCF